MKSMVSEEKETTQPCTEHTERIKNIIGTIEELNDCKDDTMSPPEPKCQAALDAYFTLEDCNKAISRRKDSSTEEQDLLKIFANISQHLPLRQSNTFLQIFFARSIGFDLNAGCPLARRSKGVVKPLRAAAARGRTVL